TEATSTQARIALQAGRIGARALSGQFLGDAGGDIATPSSDAARQCEYHKNGPFNETEHQTERSAETCERASRYHTRSVAANRQSGHHPGNTPTAIGRSWHARNSVQSYYIACPYAHHRRQHHTHAQSHAQRQPISHRDDSSGTTHRPDRERSGK